MTPANPDTNPNKEIPMNTNDFTVRLAPETGRTVAVWQWEQFEGRPSDANVRYWVDAVDAALAANDYARVGLIRFTVDAVTCDVRQAR